MYIFLILGIFLRLKIWRIQSTFFATLLESMPRLIMYLPRTLNFTQVPTWSASFLKCYDEMNLCCIWTDRKYLFYRFLKSTVTKQCLPPKLNWYKQICNNISFKIIKNNHLIGRWKNWTKALLYLFIKKSAVIAIQYPNRKNGCLLMSRMVFMYVSLHSCSYFS